MSDRWCFGYLALTRGCYACTGNVGRFLNHSCSPNCVIVAVLTEASANLVSHDPTSSSGLCYRICLFAEQDIPAYTELVYNYSKPV